MNFMLSGLLAAALVATNSVNVAETPAATNSDAVAEAPAKTNRMAKITSAKTYYDAKDGVAYFSGHVHVEDDQYQLHSDTAYVFMDKTGTNDLKRIVAIGNVALTNETRRAYGAKASYYRENGMVVLYAPEGGLCEVRDEKESPPQSVKGTKIKFWVDSEQIEVQGASISAPVTGDSADGLKKTIGGKNK